MSKKIISITFIISICITSKLVFANANIEFISTVPDETNHGVLFVTDFSNLEGQAKEIDQASNGLLGKTLKYHSENTPNQHYLELYAIAEFDKLVVIEHSDSMLSKVELNNLGGKIAKILNNQLNGNQFIVYSQSINADEAAIEAHLALGYKLRSYQFNKYKSNASNDTGSIIFVGDDIEVSRQVYQNDLAHLAEGVYLTRNLSSEPGKTIYPQSFVDEVKKQFKGVKNIDIDVLTLRDMKKRNMGALMGVGKGSIHDPRLLVIEYSGADKKQQPIALVGKGITFDTGGISLKQNSGMWAMKSDMAGAAAVAGSIYAAAKRKEQINIVGLMALAENMPGPEAIRPGDVLETMKGTTIEILSTDAEGRLVLADAVYYAQQEFNPKMLLNIATLTGSAARALSDEYAVVITRDWELSVEMMSIGKQSGEHVWPLPLHPNHFKQISSDIADIKNSGAGNPGASIGAAVIGTFIDDNLPWVHLDIAGVDWLSESTDTTPIGSSGWGVRFMTELIRREAKQDSN